jgi:hypothetical protein
MCFVTQNGDVGGSAGSADVDGGSTSLVSPLLDLEGTDGIISYARWFFDSQSTDQLLTYVSNDDGDTWAFVHQTGGTGSEWETANFAIGTFIETTSQMRVAFVAEDTEPASIVEAGIDNFQLEIIDCGTSICLGDVNVDNVVDVSDLLIIIDAWGSDDQSADIDGDGSVTIEDLLVVVGNWGSCSQ